MGDDLFQRYGEYYDLLYRDKDYKAETSYVAKSLRTFLPRVHTILEFGSGTGKHGRLLAYEGFQVVGLERSASMVGVANQPGKAQSSNGGSFDCAQGDITTTRLDQTFDAVIALFHVISYQTLNHQVLQTFANAATHLEEGGVFLFDVWHGPAVLSQRPSVRVKRIEDDTTRLTRIAEPALDLNSSIVTVHYTMMADSKAGGGLTTFEEDHQMRYFFPSEIFLIANQTGFSVEHSEEFLTGQVPTENTWGVAYVLRKRS